MAELSFEVTVLAGELSNSALAKALLADSCYTQRLVRMGERSSLELVKVLTEDGLRKVSYARATKCLGCFLPLVVFIASCAVIPSHFHDETRAMAARKGRDTMNTYSNNAPQMYSRMTTNLLQFETAEDSLLNDLETNNEQEKTTVYASILTGGELATRRTKTQDCATRLLKLLESGTVSPESIDWPYCKGSMPKDCRPDSEENHTAFQTLLCQLHEVLEDGDESPNEKTLKAEITEQSRKVENAKQDVSKWNASVALMHAAIQEVPDGRTGFGQAKDVVDLGKLAQTVGQREVDYVDADGKTVKSTVGGIIAAAGEQSASAQDAKSFTGGLRDSPGLELEVANLGLTMLKLEQKQAQARLAHERATMKEINQVAAELKVALALSSQGTEPFARLTVAQTLDDANHCRRRIEGVQVIKPCMPNDRIKGMAAVLLGVRGETLAESITDRAYTRLPLALARLKHAQSIEDSQTGDEAYRALISSGLGGLVAYHEGGLTSDEVASIASFGQAIAVGVLAARVH